MSSKTLKNSEILVKKTLSKSDFYDHILDGLHGKLPADVPQLENKRGKNHFQYNGKQYEIRRVEIEIPMIGKYGKQYTQKSSEYRVFCLNGESDFSEHNVGTKEEVLFSLNEELKNQWKKQYESRKPEYHTPQEFSESYEKLAADEKVQILENAIKHIELGAKKWDAIYKVCGYVKTPSGKLVSSEYMKSHKAPFRLSRG